MPDSETVKSKGDEQSVSLGARAAQGAKKALSGQLVLFLFQGISVVVLARLLTQSDYGLTGMVLAILGIGHLLRDVGLSSAAIQARTLSRSQRDNLFWVNSAVGLALTAVAILSAPALANFYGRSEVLGIALAMSPTFLFSGIVTQWRADLVRHVQFGRIAVAEISGAAVGLLSALTCAFLGGGYWALVLQQLIGGAVTMIVIGCIAGWLPKPYDRQAPMRKFFSFGLPIFGTQLLTYASMNADSVLMGRLFGAAPLGLYNRGLQVVRISMNQIRTPLGSLSLSILSKIENDDDRFKKFIGRGQIVVNYPLLAAVGGLVATAPQVVGIMLGSEWGGVSDFVRLIAIGEGLDTLASVGSWILISRGLSKQLMRLTIFTTCAKISFLVAGSFFGPVGIAVGFALSPIVLWPISLYWVGKASGLGSKSLIGNSYRIVAVIAPASICAWFAAQAVDPLAGPILAIVCAAVALVAVVAIASVVPRVRADYLDVWGTFKLMRSNGKMAD